MTADLLGRLETWVDRYEAEGAAPIVEAWKERAEILGRRVQAWVDGVRVVGRARDLDEDGALRIERDGGGELRVVAGEIAVLVEPAS